MLRLQTSTNMGGDGESAFTLIRVPRKAQASFLRGLDEIHCTLWLCWKYLNYLGWSDLKIKMSASHKVPWYSLLCRDLHCSLGLVIIPEHLWGNESYLHISNKHEECQTQQSRLALAPTPPSCGCRRLVEHGPQPRSAEMRLVVFSTAGILLHELGESNQWDMLSSVSKDHDLLKNSP